MSTRSSDYAAIGGGGDGVGGGSRSSRRLARGPLPGGKEEENDNSTPVAFDVDDYWKQNLFMFDKLVRMLDKSLSLTIHPTLDEDFLDYSKLLDGLYQPLTGNIKTNHIFSCTDGGTQITIRQSNLEEHQEYVLNLQKRGTWDGVTRAQLIEHADKVLKPIQCVGLNLYKTVEMYKNYRPNIPVEYHYDVMYMEPNEEVGLKVKVEKTERSEFLVNLKAKKYAGKEQIESVAFGDGEAKM